MKGIIRWFRRVYPPAWAVLIVVVFVAALEAVFWWTRLMLLVSTDSLSAGLRARDAVMVLSAAGYAAFRVVAFHPIFRPKYRGWLELTPWTADKPLPLGPVTLVVQDLVLILLMRPLLHDYQLPEPLLPLAFLFSYVATATIAIFGSGERRTGYVLLFGLGAAIRCSWWTPWGTLLVLAACYGVVVHGMKRSLAAFPWSGQLTDLRKHFTDARQVGGGELEAAHLGWPYHLLNPTDAESVLSRRDRILIGLTAGWVFYSIAVGFPYDVPDNVAGLLFAVACLTGACTFGRLALYCVSYRPPITFWGRLRTGRWIIPAYDGGLIAPASVAIIGWGGVVAVGAVARQQPLLAPVLAAILVASLLMVTLVAGPSYRDWRLSAPAGSRQPDWRWQINSKSSERRASSR